jgi:hypothetical protein
VGSTATDVSAGAFGGDEVDEGVVEFLAHIEPTPAMIVTMAIDKQRELVITFMLSD